MNPWVAGLIGTMVFIAGFLCGQTYEIKSYTKWLKDLDKKLPNKIPNWRNYMEQLHERK